MDINLENYKNEFLNIKIQIIPKENTYGKFINLSSKNIHIYFNDNNEDIKTKEITEYDKVSKIKIIINYGLKSLSKLFYDCNCIKKINFIKFKIDDFKSMSEMFYGCSLEELNISNFNSNNVTNMKGMFRDCISLKELNLSNFNTYNVSKMNNMFSYCSSLKKLNLSNFSNNKLTNMRYMFECCRSLTELNLSNFNINNVTDMYRMFSGCSSLKELNLNNFN